MEQSPREANRFFSQSRNSPHIMEREGSLPKSRVPATCPYPEPARFILPQSISLDPRLTLWPCRNPILFYGKELLAPPPTTPNWRTTPCRLSATAFLIHSRLPSIFVAVPPSVTWGRAMPWWQGPTYQGNLVTRYIKQFTKTVCRTQSVAR